MNKFVLGFLLAFFSLPLFAQTGLNTNTLLWKISGKNLAKPSYLFGTIHMLCADDIQLSDSLQKAIANSDKVYLEVDLDNMLEMLGVMTKMKMRNDTTLADLLSKEDYQKVKTFFNKQGGLLPFSMLETYKPLLAASTLMQSSLDCSNPVAMEQLIMKDAKSKGKGIKGLESMAYQMSIFDSIPYTAQAKQLLSFVDNYGKSSDDSEFKTLTEAYRNQELEKLEKLTQDDDMGIANFSDILLYNRNRAWVAKLEDIMVKNALVVAVGAGHLPGEKGVINLLRKAGYKVEPVKNDMIKKLKTKEL